MILSIMLLRKARTLRASMAGGLREAVIGSGLGLVVAFVLLVGFGSRSEQPACPEGLAVSATECVIPASLTVPWAPPAPKTSVVLPAIEPNVAR